MEKALEILKETLYIGRSRQGDDFDYIVCGKIKDAIKELEEAMKPKTCEGCKNLYINQYDEFSDYCKELGIEISKAETANFYCNRYEAKDTQ